MTDFDKPSILLSDFDTTGSGVVATNLAQNPGFETGKQYVLTNYARYTSARSGSIAGWRKPGTAHNAMFPSANTAFPGGRAYRLDSTGVWTGDIVTSDYTTPSTLPVPTGSTSNVAVLYVQTTSNAIPMYVKIDEYTSAGVFVGSPGSTSWTSVAGEVRRVLVQYTLSSADNTAVFRVGTSSSADTGTLYFDAALVTRDALGPPNVWRPFFDGSYFGSSGATVSWDGIPYQSTSTLNAATPKDLSPDYDSYCMPLLSSSWRNHGKLSLHQMAMGDGLTNNTETLVAGSYSSLSGGGVTLIPGHTYRIMATIHLESPQTGTTASYPRCIGFYDGTYGDTVTSPSAPNQAGSYPLELIYTLLPGATSAAVRLINGSYSSSVWWDDLLIVDLTAGGAYTGGWFSGSSLPQWGQIVAWTGDAEDSTSTLSTLGPQAKLAELQSLSYEYAGISSPYADDTGLSLGVANLTTKTKKNLKFWQGKIVWPWRGAGNPRRAIVRSVSKSQDVWTVAADTGATERNYDYSFQPVVSNGTGVYFTTVEGKALLPVTNPESVVPQKTLPGYLGNGLSAIAQLAQAYRGFAVEDEANASYALRARTGGEANVTHPQNISGWGMTVDRAEPARSIEVIWYEGDYGDNIEVVPPDADIITVDAGETVEVDIETGAWLRNVNQPVCVDWVEADENYYSGTNGVYAVAGSDNRPITAAEWLANGGVVTVAISPDDPRTMRVTVKGMSSSGTAHLGPYRIAMVNTIGGDYPALRVTADAVRAIPHTLKLPTGVDEAITKTDVGVTVDNPFIQSLDQAYSVGVRLARKYCGLVMSLSGGGEGIQPHQLLDYEWMRYIVRDISGDPTKTVSFDAEEYTQMSDFEESWPRATYTMQDFQNVWPRSQYTMGQYMLEQLRNPLRDGTGHFYDLYNGLWESDEVGATDNGDGTWSSDYAVDNGDGTWTG